MLGNFGSANLTSLIPKGQDPCDPGRLGAIMVVNGDDGSPLKKSPINGAGGAGGNDVIGLLHKGPTIPIGGVPSIVGNDAGQLIIPGIGSLGIPIAPQHRGAWRELLNQL